jgi:hypothetical protein
MVVWNGRDANIPGDNPVYMLAPEESHDNSTVYDVIGQPLKQEEERHFHNPMYGNPEPQEYEVPATRAGDEERMFENPTYAQPDPMTYEVPVRSS